MSLKDAPFRRNVPVGPPAKAIRGGSVYNNVFWHLGTANTSTFGAGFAIAMPAQYTAAWTLDRVGLEVTSAGVSSSVRLGLYSDNGAWKPGALIQEFTSGGAIDSASTGLKELTVSQAFQAGVIYWWAILPLTATVGFRTVTPSWPPFPTSQAESTNPAGRYGHEWSTGTLGSTWSGTTFGGGAAPSIFARAV